MKVWTFPADPGSGKRSVLDSENCGVRMKISDAADMTPEAMANLLATSALLGEFVRSVGYFPKLCSDHMVCLCDMHVVSDWFVP